MCRWLVALVLFSSVASAKSRDVHAEVSALSHAYLDGLFAARPHLATFMGDHRFDDRLVDLSDAALERRHRELVAVLKRVDALHATVLDDKVDLAIVSDGAKLELLYLDGIRDWTWDARLYDSFPYYDPREIVAGRLSDIIHGDFATEAVRRKSVIAELTALPTLLKQSEGWLARSYRAKTATRRPPKVYVEQAIKDNQGRIDFLRTDVAPFVATDARGPGAVQAATVALQAFQVFLEKELLAEADGDWRLGRALYDRKFPLALQTVRTPDEMVARAQAEFAKSRAALAEVARTLHAQLWPGVAPPAGEAALIGKVKDALAHDHAKPAELVAAHARRLDALRAFIEKHHIVDLPPKETLSVEPMPMFKRGSSAAEYLAPGVLEQRPTFHATYYVDPIDPSWAPERVESYLRGQNDYEVELVAAHEAYPGHHTQFAQSRKSFDPLRATLWNGPMVEGWAVYIEGQVVADGWGGDKNDRYRFFDLRGRMVSAANLILDVKLQRGEMTDEEAIRFMVEDGFQEKAMAEKKLLRAKLDSTQLCQYYLGLSEIESLKADVKKARGESPTFDYDFDMALISHGSIAVRFLRDYLLP